MRLSNIFAAFGLALAAVAAPLTVNASEAPAREISAKETTQVKARTGGILIEVADEEPVHVVIYALTGQVVKQLDLAAGQTLVELPAGYYIVRAGHTTVKVAVK